MIHKYGSGVVSKPGSGGEMSGAEIEAALYAEDDNNRFTDGDKSTLLGLRQKSDVSLSHERDLKIFEKRAGNRFYVIQPTPSGYSQVLFQSGIKTTVDSLGGDAELVRATSVDYLNDVVVALNTVYSSASTNINHGPAAPASSNVERYFVDSGHLSARGSAALNYHRVLAGGYIEYELPVTAPLLNNSPVFNLAFFTSLSSTDDVSITVDGVTVATGVKLNEAQAKIKIVELSVPISNKNGDNSGKIIRITNNGSSQAYVICANLYKLKDLPNRNIPVDTYRVFLAGAQYRSNIAAADYAIYDRDDNVWMGSYHGGETSTSLSVEVNGFAFDMSAPSQTFALADSIVMKQITDINSKFVSTVITDASVKHGYDLRINLAGVVRVRHLYTAMATTDESFTEVRAPVPITLGADGDYLMSETSYIEQYRPPTSVVPALSASIEFTTFSSEHNAAKGAFVKLSAGNYAKCYYAPYKDADVVCNGINFSSKHRFY